MNYKEYLKEHWFWMGTSLTFGLVLLLEEETNYMVIGIMILCMIGYELSEIRVAVKK